MGIRLVVLSIHINIHLYSVLSAVAVYVMYIHLGNHLVTSHRSE